MSDRFGPFRILAPIGKGGMSQTHLAERIGPAGIRQRVCLKRLRSTEAEDPRWISMFQTEARIAASLHHQNIVSLHDFGFDEGTWWMSMQLVQGTDLRAILGRLGERGERLPLQAVQHIVVELAKALAYVHSRCDEETGVPLGLVHRDVSPGNVLVSREGEVLLTDFGIAKVTFGERSRTGEIKGKAPYMSPEQSIGDELDGRSDLFSLGVVIFEMLTGQRPFDGRTWLATQQNAYLGVRRGVRELVEGVPDGWVALVDGLLRAKREQREPAGAEGAVEILEVTDRAAIARRTLRELIART